jgi:predicted lipoprotein with Yx(FWY)xxD motif
MLKSILSTAALLAVFAAGSALAAEPATTTPPTMKDGMFVTTKGMTLYTFDKDATPGKSVCNGPCATNWPPALAADGAKATGDWTIVTRDDGLKQWAYKGKPLYAFAKDTKAGDKTGDGFLNGAWHIAK